LRHDLQKGLKLSILDTATEDFTIISTDAPSAKGGAVSLPYVRSSTLIKSVVTPDKSGALRLATDFLSTPQLSEMIDVFKEDSKYDLGEFKIENINGIYEVTSNKKDQEWILRETDIWMNYFDKLVNKLELMDSDYYSGLELPQVPSGRAVLS
jgi:hypothetical protein